ncbi:MAG: DUF4430 domain-containing protein, partial [Candidatus Thorarchaeota archaeon]
GFRSSFDTSSNSATTAWAIMALHTAGQDLSTWTKDQTPTDFLLSLQRPDGGFNYSFASNYEPFTPLMTAYSLQALAGVPYPVATTLPHETTAHVLVEADTTIIDRDVTFTQSTILDTEGTSHSICIPTALGALTQAATDSGIATDIQYYPGFGLFITGIAGYDSTLGYWMYEVNAEQAMVGAGDYAINDADIIRWYFTSTVTPTPTPEPTPAISSLIFEDVKVRVDGKTDRRINDGDRISEEAEPGSEIEIELDVTNNNDYEIEDIEVEVEIIIPGQDIEDESSEFNLDPQESKDIDFNMVLPETAREDTANIKITAEGKLNDSLIELVWRLTLKIEREKHSIVLEASHQGTAACNQQSTFSTTLTNFGTETEELVCSLARDGEVLDTAEISVQPNYRRADPELHFDYLAVVAEEELVVSCIGDDITSSIALDMYSDCSADNRSEIPGNFLVHETSNDIDSGHQNPPSYAKTTQKGTPLIVSAPLHQNTMLINVIVLLLLLLGGIFGWLVYAQYY